MGKITNPTELKKNCLGPVQSFIMYNPAGYYNY